MTAGSRARTAPFLAVLAAIGLADAITASYLVLFAADELGLSALQVGIATSVLTLSGIVLGVLAARRVDRAPSRLPLAVGLAVAAVGFGAFTVVRGFVPLLVVCVLAGAINVGFPQVFALEHLSRSQEGVGATAVLRGTWSVSWAVGPVIAGAVVLASGYGPLFGAAAVLLLAAAVAVRALPPPVRAEAQPAPATTAARPGVVLPVAAVVLFHTAMFIGSFVLPLQLTRLLHASSGWVGVVFGVCAGIEVLVSIALASFGRRLPAAVGLVGAAAAFVLYFVGMGLAPGPGWVVALQLLRGLGIAAMGILGIELLQRRLAPAVAGATALFANALAAGALVSGVAAGVLVDTVGIRPALIVCAALAALAVGCLVVDASRRATAPAGIS